MRRSEEWRDITDHFEFIEESLIYVDAPLEGLLRAKAGDLFAFRCSPIMRGCLWHWVLIPVEAAGPVKDVFENARTSPPTEWISIVEDRRDEPRLLAVWLAGDVHEIPKNVFDG